MIDWIIEAVAIYIGGWVSAAILGFVFALVVSVATTSLVPIISYATGFVFGGMLALDRMKSRNRRT